ncbi:PCP reductase family protein [Waterburya agarophytonicola K14]|uniref:PCP reductase family protein n=1 Tax=Waterburya agarophytonicola KI4 TaxID=2874699 RepID=A0A964BUB8_9CYAN|nr:PCP reductase family protein [Waterburya agarophytonicola]MCC0178852.1 PCP reductase family protein [Waterburya agarophytonicola KI4]
MKNFNVTDELYWTPQAQAKLRMIPFFARPQARQRIETMARAAELEEITAEIVLQARMEFGQ